MNSDTLFIIECAAKEALKRRLFDDMASITCAFIDLRSKVKLKDYQLSALKEDVDVYMDEMLSVILNRTRLNLDMAGKVKG